MQWDSPWGRGFPGWHIECSAMSMKYLGPTFDIHCGGEDNIFPHHESEIAQSECANGQPFVRTWLHSRFLLVDGKKMSKSLGNFFTVRDILERGFDAATLRYTLLRVHYRQPINFTFDLLEDSKTAVQRLIDFRRRLSSVPDRATGETQHLADQAVEHFQEALDDDLNISAALGTLFDFLRAAHRALDLHGTGAGVFLGALQKMDQELGVLEMFPEQGILDDEVELLIRRRTEARARRDFAESDRIRDLLKGRGILLEDSKTGTLWKRSR
jgi:cysteinyl-tRNA synthetase